jgi:hypothetical protein
LQSFTLKQYFSHFCYNMTHLITWCYCHWCHVLLIKYTGVSWYEWMETALKRELWP